MASPIKGEAWLEWMASITGAASRQSLSAILPPEQFHCLLDELPLHLIPGHHTDGKRQPQDQPDSDFLNPHCSILPAGNVPTELEARRDLLEGFYMGRSMAWVRDPCSGSLHPFWLGTRTESVLSQIQAGELNPSSLPCQLRRVLTSAGILISAGESERRRAEWNAISEHGAEVFREKKYFPLSGLIHPFHIAALRRYYRYAIRKGAIWLGDDQSPRRYVAHNQSVARYFHHQIASVVSAIAGQPVKPSYVYLASYLSGAEIKKHIDREQCEFSVTLCLDFSPEPKSATPWPIRLETDHGNIAVYQGLGDSLLYRGTSVPHYRDILPQGYTSTSIFFHYVPENFSGPLD
jgi:hypothetical protein